MSRGFSATPEFLVDFIQEPELVFHALATKIFINCGIASDGLGGLPPKMLLSLPP